MNNKKKIGIIIIIVAIVVCVFSTVKYFKNKSKPNTVHAEKKIVKEIDEEKKERNRNEAIIESENTANDTVDIDPNVAKEMMSLGSFKIKKEMLPYLGGNEQRIEKELEDYLVEEDLYTDITDVSCTNILIYDFLKEEGQTSFDTKSEQNWIINMTYNKANDRLTFSYFGR